MLDAVRMFAVILGGLSFGAALTVGRLMVSRATRAEAFAIRGFITIHLLVVLYITGVIAARHGEPLSWYTPGALMIFTAKVVLLLMLREVFLSRELRQSPPGRRSDDFPLPAP